MGVPLRGMIFFWWESFSPSLFWDPALRPGTVAVAHFNGRLPPDSVDSKESRLAMGDNQDPCQGDGGVNIMTP